MEAGEIFSWKPSGAVGSSIYHWELLILFPCHRSVPPSAGTEKCSISARGCWWHLYSPSQQNGEPRWSKGLCLGLCSKAWGILKPFKVFVLQVCKGLSVIHSSPTENYSRLRSWQFMHDWKYLRYRHIPAESNLTLSIKCSCLNGWDKPARTLYLTNHLILNSNSFLTVLWYIAVSYSR